MHYNPRRKKENRGSPRWMTTYSDMMTLILVFFILLYAFSEIDITKFKALSDSFVNRPVFEFRSSTVPLDYNSSIIDTGMDNGQGKGSSGDNQDQSTSDAINDENNEDVKRLGKKALENQRKLNEVLDRVNQFLDQNEMTHAVSATRDERGVVLVLQDRVLFNSGEAEILDEALPFLTKVADLIKALPNQVEIQGHTDNVPISSYRYPSNWELSTARASRVVRFFVEEKGLEPSRFVAVGYGQYSPIDDNHTEQGRQNNRRVEIVINNLDDDKN